jgi:hypothetical protein
MDKKHILKQEGGVLYLKLRETFNPSTMSLHHTVTRIDRSGVRIVRAHSDDIPNHESFSKEEMTLLVEGWQIVQAYWESEPLPHRHVLLDCGCIVDWDELQEQMNGRVGVPRESYYRMPQEGDWTWCSEHEDARVYRFCVSDFIEASGEPEEPLPF